MACKMTITEYENRKTECLAACSGVTFIGDPEGMIKRMAEALRGVIDLCSSYNTNDPEMRIARAVLSQMQIEPITVDSASERIRRNEQVT